MRLNQVTVTAVDLDASIAFYQTLDFRLIVKNDYHARFEIDDGESTFSHRLVACPSAASGQEQTARPVGCSSAD